MTVSQRAQQQEDPEPEAARCHSAISDFIVNACTFPSLTWLTKLFRLNLHTSQHDLTAKSPLHYFKLTFLPASFGVVCVEWIGCKWIALHLNLNLNRHVNGSQIFQCHWPTTATNSYFLWMNNLLIINLLVFTVLEKCQLQFPLEVTMIWDDDDKRHIYMFEFVKHTNMWQFSLNNKLINQGFSFG